MLAGRSNGDLSAGLASAQPEDYGCAVSALRTQMAPTLHGIQKRGMMDTAESVCWVAPAEGMRLGPGPSILL